MPAVYVNGTPPRILVWQLCAHFFLCSCVCEMCNSITLFGRVTMVLPKFPAGHQTIYSGNEFLR